MQKLNVLFLTSWYPNRHHATQGNFVQKHAEALTKCNVNLKVLHICSSSSNQQKFDIEQNIINGVDTTIVYYKKIPGFNPLKGLIKYFRYKQALKFGIKNINLKFDITHCHVSYPAGILARHILKKENIPYVLSEHWTLFTRSDEYQKYSFFIRNSIQKTFNKASFIFPVSDSLQKSIEPFTSNTKFKTIYNVVNTDLFTPEIQTHPIKTILHVSHMDQLHKNAEGMLQAIKNVSSKRTDFVFKIIADENHEKTRAIINKLEIPNELIKLESTKTATEISKDFSNADFFVLFSNYETFSVVMAEAWCAGLPIVYSKCGGLTDIIDDKLGIQIKPKDIKALENSINYMLDHCRNYDKNYISQFATSRFNENEIASQFIDAYKSVLGI